MNQWLTRWCSSLAREIEGRNTSPAEKTALNVKISEWNCWDRLKAASSFFFAPAPSSILNPAWCELRWWVRMPAAALVQYTSYVRSCSWFDTVFERSTPSCKKDRLIYTEHVRLTCSFSLIMTNALSHWDIYLPFGQYEAETDWSPRLQWREPLYLFTSCGSKTLFSQGYEWTINWLDLCVTKTQQKYPNLSWTWFLSLCSPIPCCTLRKKMRYLRRRSKIKCTRYLARSTKMEPR